MRSLTRCSRELCSLSRALPSLSAPKSTCRAAALATAISTRTATVGQLSSRTIHTTRCLRKGQDSPASHQPTDFNELDVLGGMPAPSTSVDVCFSDGFGLNSGVTITDGDGAMLVNGEAFAWRPWEAIGKMELVNKKGQFDLPAEVFSMLDMLWPRPDLLIIGVGKSNLPLSPETRSHISSLGIRVEVLDTRNAAAQFNLLATERGLSEVAAALIPIGWQEGKGAQD